MVAVPFYQPLDATLCQGDVFDFLPLVYVKDQAAIVKRATLPGNRDGFEIVAPTPNTTQPKSGPSPTVVAPCDFSRAVLLTYDCEIDKPAAKFMTFALVRPLDPRMPDSDKATIRENRKFACFYLPGEPANAPEAYVDFRRLSTVGIDLVKSANRISRLTDQSRKGLLFQFYRYLARVDLRKAVLPPTEEEIQLR